MVIRDVIHNDITITDLTIKKLIRTIEFQRLRKIKQLGLTYLIFPSAEHSRFSHSIGVYHLAGKTIKLLGENYNFNQDDVDAFLIASLLHDVGHGPMSHTSEEFFHFKHEQFSVDLISGETEINKVLKEQCQNLIEPIVAYINKTHPNKILTNLLSGSIDVDRMDYLFRDSHHVGVTYGEFDYNRLMKIMTIYEDKLVYLEKGIHTIEDFIMCRYHMFSQVYLNDKSIGYEFLAKEILTRLKELYVSNADINTDIELLKPFLNADIKIPDYISMNDYIMFSIFESLAVNEKDEKLRILASAFIHNTLDTCKKANSDFEIQTAPIAKKIYNESIMILCDNGLVKKLEDVSPLIKFIKEDLKIKHEIRTFFVSKNEK